MAEEDIAQFTAITNAAPASAQQYLQLADGNLEGAIELFFAAGDGGSIDQTPSTHQPLDVPPTSTRPRGNEQSRDLDAEVINLSSDEEHQNPADDDEVQLTGAAQRHGIGSLRTEGALHTPPTANTPPAATTNDDEAMARRLQEEYYGDGHAAPRNGGGDVLDEYGYRAPLQRTTETLVGPGEVDAASADDMRAAVMDQMRARRQHRQQRDHRGIFNQGTDSSIWDQDREPSQDNRDALSRATGGASEISSKANHLAELYRPPVELISRLPWEAARDEGKENKKWILVNIQNPSIFDCQLLNRDIWKNPGIVETVRENFIFMQYSMDDQRGSQYMQYYFPNRQEGDSYPHIAIVDPRTGEQVKKWSGPPGPKAADFLMQLHEFLDRYSLQATAKNPVAKRKPEQKKETQIDRLTEEQQLEMALKASLAGSSEQKAEDPDDLTRSIGNLAGSSAKADGSARDTVMSDVSEEPPTNGEAEPSFPSKLSSISSSRPHTEPAPSEPNSTRIQFRHPNGRVVRRFLLSDHVVRLYEWLKSAPLEGREGKEFELVFMQKNLFDNLDQSIEEAGLKNGTVMVEIIEGDA